MLNSSCHCFLGESMRRLLASLVVIALSAPLLASAQVTVSYTYDALGRLKKAEPTTGNATCYSYDGAHNRATVQGGCTANSPPTANYDYFFDVAWDVWSYSGYLGVLANDTDPNLPADTLTVTGVSGSAYASVASNDVYFSGPPGFYSLTYTIQDSAGATSYASVDVEIIYCTTWGGC